MMWLGFIDNRTFKLYKIYVMLSLKATVYAGVKQIVGIWSLLLSQFPAKATVRKVISYNILSLASPVSQKLGCNEKCIYFVIQVLLKTWHSNIVLELDMNMIFGEVK